MLSTRAACFRRTSTLAILVATSALCACVPEGLELGQTPAIPAHYTAALRPIAAQPVSTDWPALFGVPELTRLAGAVTTDNFDIAAAVARIQQAEAQAQVAGAALQPELSGTSNAQRTISPGTARSLSPPFRSTASNLMSLGVSASYALDFFGKNAATLDAARLSLVATTYDRDTVVLTSLASVTNAYFTMLAAQDRLAIAKSNIRSAVEILEAIKARLSVGTATLLDTAQQESLLANERATVPALQQTLDQTRNTLAVLAGQTPEAFALQGGSLRALTIPRIAPGLPAELLARRPDVASAEAQLAAQHANVRAARAAFFPSITLTGSAGPESLILHNLLRPEALAASFAAGLTQPIFNGGNLAGLQRQAEGRELELLATYRKTIVQAYTDVENALIAVQQTSATVRLRALAVQTAQRAYDITKVRLREGTIDVVTMLNTQQTLFTAQDTLVQAQLARAQAFVSLFQALGGGFQTSPVLQTQMADTTSQAPEATP